MLRGLIYQRSKSMSEYIKREDALNTIREALLNIDTCPSADVVEVVRCGECEYWNGVKCTLREIFVYGNDFCSDGERKDGEE